MNECSCVPCGRKTSGRTNKKATFDEMQDIPRKAINPEYELSDENAILMNRALGVRASKICHSNSQITDSIRDSR